MKNQKRLAIIGVCQTDTFHYLLLCRNPPQKKKKKFETFQRYFERTKKKDQTTRMWKEEKFTTSICTEWN